MQLLRPRRILLPLLDLRRRIRRRRCHRPERRVRQIRLVTQSMQRLVVAVRARLEPVAQLAVPDARLPHLAVYPGHVGFGFGAVPAQVLDVVLAEDVLVVVALGGCIVVALDVAVAGLGVEHVAHVLALGGGAAETGLGA